MKFPWQKRDDLQIQPHDSGGWLIKDPVSLQYTLLSPLEYRVFQQLDGHTNVPSLLTASPDSPLTSSDLESFLGHLIRRQLIYRPGGGEADRLQQSRRAKSSIFKYATRLISWQVPLGNPRRLLDRLEWITRPASDPVVIRVCVALIFLALILLVANFNDLWADAGQLARSLTASAAITMLLIVVFVKLAHELGHALAARYFGADCHEAGVLLLFLTPMPFTNVTDSWKLPARQRIIVTGAGIAIELLIASVCVILWSFAAEGTTRTILLQTALICSINTLLFNGNPLLKFDGYFLLSDYLRIPNLAPRSFDLLRSRLTAFVSGQPIKQNPNEDHSNVLFAYGILASCYRLLLTLAILETIHLLTSSNDYNTIGWLLKILTATFLVGVPFIKSLLLITTPVETTETETGSEDAANSVNRALMVKGRWRSLATVGILLLIASIPLPDRVVSVATVTPGPDRIYASVSGVLSLDSDSAGAGETAETWHLTSDQSDLNLIRLRSEVELARLQLQIAKRSPGSRRGDSIPELTQAVALAEARLKGFETSQEKQQFLTSMASDKVIPVRMFRPDIHGEFDESWTDYPLSKANMGAWIQQGETLGHLTSSSSVTVTAWVSQDEIQEIHAGRKATFRLDSAGVAIIPATVEEVGRLAADFLPGNLAVSGEFPGAVPSHGNETSFRPDNVFFPVTIRLTDLPNDVQLPIHGTGHVAIKVGSKSLAGRIYRYLRRTFLFTDRT